jgi:hypothetical protein
VEATVTRMGPVERNPLSSSTLEQDIKIQEIPRKRSETVMSKELWKKE